LNAFNAIRGKAVPLLFMVFSLMLSLMLGCSGLPPPSGSPISIRTIDSIAPRSLLREVPFFAQKDHQCGPAALAMALAFSGVSVSPDDISPMVFTPSLEGSLQPDLISAARRMGRLAYPITGMDALLLEISAGNPVIVLQNLGLRWIPVWHYAPAVGYDLTRETVLLHSGAEPFKEVDLKIFQRTWRRGRTWGLLVLPPERLPATAELEPSIRAVIGLEKAGSLRQASAGYRAIMDRWPESVAAHIGLANCRYRLGRLSEAEAVLREAACRFPREGSVFNNLAQILSEGNKTEEALEAARKAVGCGGPLKRIYLETLEEIKRQMAVTGKS
jgi:hypothetical protein